MTEKPLNTQNVGGRREGDSAVDLLSSNTDNLGSNPNEGLTPVTPVREEEITNCKVKLYQLAGLDGA